MQLAPVRRALLRFFDKHARDLPWRRTKDPYAIWVSEVMLQQTRVDTVVTYYERFMRRFPTPQALSAATEDEVMASWSGLGYYRRARLLQQGVREVVERYGARVPQDPQARRGLPGIGRYTAGAIGSIAFDRPEPLVDGNVARVFARLFGVDTPLGRAQTERRLWELAEQLVQGPRPGDLNQAVMELGATVCSKAAPSCQDCPLAAHCYAHNHGAVERLPVPRAKPTPKPQSMVALLARTPQRGLLLVRGRGTLFGGLWNLPMAPGSGRPAALALMAKSGVAGRLGPEPVGELVHVLSHRRLSVQLWRPSHLRVRPDAEPRWVDPQALAERGVSALTRKALPFCGLG